MCASVGSIGNAIFTAVFGQDAAVIAPALPLVFLDAATMSPIGSSAAASAQSPSVKTAIDSPGAKATAIKIPQPQKNGNQLADEQETAVHHCFCELVSTLNQDVSWSCRCTRSS